MPRQTRRHTIAIAILFALLLTGPAAAQEGFSSDFFGDPVTVKTYLGFSSATQGGSLPIAIELDIDGKWHINANQVKDEYLIPTEISVEVPDGIEVKEIVYPRAVEKRLSFSEEKLALYDGTVYIGVLIAVDTEFPAGDTSVVASVTYQACDNEKCIAPETKRLTIPIRISTPAEAVGITNEDVFDKIEFGATTSGHHFRRHGESRRGTLRNIIETKGYFWGFLAVFLAGLALCLTPCVYPMIPITVSYFGGQSDGKTSRTVLLAFLYLLGMATMYSSLGLLAALTGGLFGAVMQNPYVLAAIAMIFVALAMSMFGLYEIRIPAALSGVAGTAKQGALGAFLMGLTVGIVAAPCIGPFVFGMLTFVGQKGSPVLGFFLFFVLAVGLGAPFVVLAILSGSITKLPKSGEWMEWIRKLFGFILLVMAVYFLRTLMQDWLSALIMGVLLIISGIILGFIIKTGSASPVFNIFRRLVGTAFVIFGIHMILTHIGPLSSKSEHGIAWQPYTSESLVKAKANGEFTLIDFSAAWCIPCKELDHKTFSPEEVVEATKTFVNLKVDMTKWGSEPIKVLREQYGILGVPVVVFIDQNGNEREDLRVVGFVDKDDFLSRVTRLKSSTR
jgi:thiol:disulfide interchange protein DsbD